MSEREDEKREREIEPWYPSDVFRAFDEMWRDFRRSFWKPWERRLQEPRRELAPREWTRAPLVDMVDEGDLYVLNAELPGLSKEDIDIEVTSDTIEITGKTERERKEEEEKYRLYEISYSKIHRRLAFPEEVKPGEAEAYLRNGVLEIRIPKKEPTPPPEEEKHKIEIE
jgi:HSP20 family protein